MGRKKKEDIESVEETVKAPVKKKTTKKESSTKKSTTTKKKTEKIVPAEPVLEVGKEDKVEVYKDVEDVEELQEVNEPKKDRLRVDEIIAIIVSVLLVLFLTYEVNLYYKVNKNDNTKVEEKDKEKNKNNASLNKEFNFSLEDEIDIINLFQNKENLGEKIEIDIINKEGEKVELTKKYFDVDGTEVTEDVALDKKGKLKGGYKYKEYLDKVGEYEIIVRDITNDKEYKAKLVIEDKVKPELILKDVTINKGEEITINSFIEKVSDNSNNDCTLVYVDENEKVIENIDTSVGERIIKIKASDNSGNYIIKEAKLIVKEVATNNTTNNNQNNKPATNNKPTVGGNTKPTVSSLYDTSPYSNTNNPVVKKALSYVGQKWMSCSMLVWTANGVHPAIKYKEIKTYSNIRNIINFQILGDGTDLSKTLDEFEIKTTIWGSKLFPDKGYLYRRLILHSKNNNVYRVEACYTEYDKEDCIVREDLTDVNDDAYNQYINKPMFKYEERTTYEPLFKTIEVPISNLQPGDRVWYEDGGFGIGHEAIYIGNGKAVHGGWGTEQDVVIYSIYVEGATAPHGERIVAK